MFYTEQVCPHFPRKAQATGSGGSESSWDRIIRCRRIYVHGFLCLYYGGLRFCRLRLTKRPQVRGAADVECKVRYGGRRHDGLLKVSPGQHLQLVAR